MPKAKTNNIEIEYDTFGDPSAKPLLLVMGMGAQMIKWDELLIEEFVKRGFYVIIFDNRDIGLSTKFEDFGVPNVMKAFGASKKGKKIESAYLLEDMANDAVGLLDVLGIEKAHICGVSLGGIIVQTMAINHPSRVLSMTSIMSIASDISIPKVTPEEMKVLATPAPKERGAFIELSAKKGRIIWGSFPYDEDKARKQAGREYDRSYYPQGGARQTVAVFASGDRTEQLASVKVPTLVIHGKEDPLAHYQLGIATSKAIPGAELLLIDGMGHSLPPETWPQVVGAIVKNTEKASN